MAGLLASAGAASSQEVCPSGTVRIIVPFPAGGPVDSAARVLSNPLAKVLDRTVLIENKSGASGSLGAAHVVQQPGDGCTILMAYDTHGVNPALIPNLPFDTLKDLRPIMLVGTIPNVVAVHASSPWRTLADLIAAARAGRLTYGTGGNGSLAHLGTKALENRLDLHMQHVPFRGGAPVVQAILGKHVDIAVGSVLSLAPVIADGSIRALAQTGATRHPFLPDVPTLAEAFGKDLTAVSWIGVFVPASAPDAVAGKIKAAFSAAIAQPDARDRLAALGVELSGAGSAELDRFLRDEIARWKQVVEKNGIRPD